MNSRPFSKKPLKEINRYSHCVFLKLQLKSPDLSAALGFRDYPDVEMTTLEVKAFLAFAGQQKVDIPCLGPLIRGGSITFGIKQGQLSLHMNNCRLPAECVALGEEFQQISLGECQRQQTRGFLAKAQIEVPNPPSIGGARESRVVETKTINTTYFHVIYSGSETDPMWTFRCSEAGKVLEGKLNRSLGQLEVEARPCNVAASFTARGEDIEITSGRIDNLIGSVIFSRNKYIAFERWFVTRYLGDIIQSAPMCSIEVQYE